MYLAKRENRTFSHHFGKKVVQVVALFGAVVLVNLDWDSDSQANETYLQIYRASTRGVVLQTNGIERQTRFAFPGSKIGLRQDKLQIAPDNKAWAALQLVADGVVQNESGLLLKTIPSWQGASYTFPCTVSGKVHVTWQPVVGEGFRACGGGLMLVKASELAHTSELEHRISAEFEPLFTAVSWPPSHSQEILWSTRFWSAGQ